MHHIIAKHFFQPPTTVKAEWTGVLTTNGVSCSWQVVKRREWCTKKKRDEPPRPVSVDTLRPVDPTTRPRDYGTHGHDCLIVPTDEPRQHVPGQHIPIIVNGMQRERTKAWRRQQLQTKLAEMGRSHFSLTNRHWHAMCGHKRARQLDLNLRAKMGLQPVIDRLSSAPSRVQTQEAYKAHLVVRLAAIGAMRMRAQAKAPYIILFIITH
jgi:hypothetical protein